jgi:glycerol-3-phosphate acyltransferase PlsY
MTLSELDAPGLVQLALVFSACYAIGSIPNAYIIVRLATGEDITRHGTGNVGAMNVRRSTGSWAWFAVAMIADGLKGFLPTLAVSLGALTVFFGADAVDAQAASMVAVLGVVVGHNYSMWVALIERRFAPSGKGLATGAGALLAYDWRYFAVAVLVGLVVIALTRYMMAGQVAATIALPLYVVLTGQPDWPFVLLLSLLVYLRHHRRFMGLLRGEEPKLYVNDGTGPRG